MNAGDASAREEPDVRAQQLLAATQPLKLQVLLQVLTPLPPAFVVQQRVTPGSQPVFTQSH